jgi:hypothetical protein
MLNSVSWFLFVTLHIHQGRRSFNKIINHNEPPTFGQNMCSCVEILLRVFFYFVVITNNLESKILWGEELQDSSKMLYTTDLWWTGLILPIITVICETFISNVCSFLFSKCESDIIVVILILMTQDGIVASVTERGRLFLLVRLDTRDRNRKEFDRRVYKVPWI